MADKRSLVSTVQLKGPAGNVTVDKRTLVTAVNIHGPTDKRTLVSQVTLVAPPPDARLQVSQVQLVGPATTSQSIYYGAPGGWVPIDVYVGPTTGVWVKIT